MPSKETQFKKGEAKGRPAGAKNRLGKSVKETVLQVFNDLQLDKKHNLKKFAETYPRDFYNIAAKLIPTEVQAKVDATVKTIIYESDERYKDTDNAGLPQE